MSDQSVKAECKSAVRRDAVFEGVKQESKLLVCLLGGHAEDLEHLCLDFSAVDSDRFPAI